MGVLHVGGLAGRLCIHVRGHHLSFIPPVPPHPGFAPCTEYIHMYSVADLLTDGATVWGSSQASVALES